MSESILNEARAHLAAIAPVYERTGYYRTHPLNEFWSSINLKQMRDLIRTAKDAQALVHGAQRTMMFSVNEENLPIAELAVDWLLDEQRPRLEPYPQTRILAESPFSFRGNNVIRDGRPLNPDFLRTVNIAAEILSHCGGGLRVVELGGGCGHLARTLREIGGSTSHVIIDIPETLTFSYCFLRLNFPDLVCVWLDEGQELPDRFDFAFVPAVLSDKVIGRPCDLFLNTASMGEMRNEVIRDWMDFIQTKLNPAYLFTMNRFLNTIHQGLMWRIEENECSVHYDANWRMLKWELEAPFSRCPYVDSRVSRCVEIIAARGPEPAGTADGLLDAIRSEDWARLWDQGHIMGMRDTPLCLDGTMDGTLYRIWNLLRLQPCAEAALLMERYLLKLQRQDGLMFEELPYYQALRERLQRMALVGSKVTARGSQPTLSYEQRSNYACKVCGAVPNEEGDRDHGKGCFTQSEGGGGSDFVELPSAADFALLSGESR